MSGHAARGRGGGRGRGQDSGRGQPSSSCAGRGGGGRRRGGDRRGGESSSSYSLGGGGARRHESSIPPPSSYSPTLTTQPLPLVPSAAAVESLREVSQKLTLEPEAARTATSPFPWSSKKEEVPRRPGTGTRGTKCALKANHFFLQVAQRDLHQYHVSITPDVPSNKMHRIIMERLTKLYKESHLGNRRPAYDGLENLYTAGALPFVSKEFSVNLDEEPGSTGTARRARQFKVTIKQAPKPKAGRETAQALAVVLKANPAMNFTTVERLFFPPELGVEGALRNGVNHWRGYYQNVHTTQKGFSLSIDVSCRSFYEPISVMEFIKKRFKDIDLSKRLLDRDRLTVEEALIGVKVQLPYMGSETRKISGLSTEPISQLKFLVGPEGESEESLVNYFHQKYEISLEHGSLPALRSGRPARPFYMPMELCKILPGQRFTQMLNDEEVRQLLKATCLRPRDKEKNINKVLRVNNFNADEFLNEEFGIEVQEKFALVEARVLPAPTLKYRDNDSGQEQVVKPMFGSWDMANKKMVDGGRVDNWTCVNFSDYKNISMRFCSKLVEKCKSKGMVFSSTPSVAIRQADPDRIDKALSDIHKESTNKPLDLLIIILPDNQKDSYGKIKRICETELGIVSQCCEPKLAAKFNNQYFNTLALKINVKVGGRNTVLIDAIRRNIPPVTDRVTIIFGADVTHPRAGDTSGPSIAAVVASMDWPQMVKYHGVISAQNHREEVIRDLFKEVQDPQGNKVGSGMIRELLMAFYKSNGVGPARIIFYRDGVGESQFNKVLLSEVHAIRKACQSIRKEYLPPVTFIVVQKRHHTRLFPAGPSPTESGNIQAGTVVDTDICHPTQFDFYLNSHRCDMGTSRPCHYHVLLDENEFSADQLQRLTNDLCYTYARSAQAMSVVPPAQYAHLLAHRARHYGEDGRKLGALPTIKANVQRSMFYC